MIVARYLYYGDAMEEPLEYSCVEDFLLDLFEDIDIIHFLNEIYGEIDIPCVGVKPAGDVIFKMLNGNHIGCRPEWDAIYNDVIQSEVEYIEDSLAAHGKIIYRDYSLTDTDFSEEE